MTAASMKNIYSLVDIKVNMPFAYKQVVSCKALKFIADLHLNFNDRRLELLAMREEKRKRNSKNINAEMAQNSRDDHNSNLKSSFNLNVFKDRQIEILGPDEIDSKKNLFQLEDKINLIHFESANSRSWSNLIEIHIIIKDAINSKFNSALSNDDQVSYTTANDIPVMVCPRNLNMDEKNLYVDGNPLSAAFFDLGLFLFHNAKNLAENGSCAYLYLNNIENYYEAKFWKEIIAYSEEELSLPEGTIKTMMSLAPWLAGFEKEHINKELKGYLLN
jgi:malate synthase